MSLSLRETRQILKTVPLANLPTRSKSSRLFGLRRCVLSPSFFSNNEARSSVKTPFFSIYTSRLTKEIFDKVNGGPSWLKGAYPPGVLSGKHERYRLINYVPPRMKLSDVKQVKAVQSSDQQRAQRIAQTRLPILQADEPENDLIPVVYLATKKRTHKDAAKRNMARHKVRTALEVVVKELEGTSSEIMKDVSTALVVQVERSTIKASSDAIIKQMRAALLSLGNYRAKALHKKSQTHISSPMMRSRRESHRERLSKSH